ncbi:hypothetical protein DL764_009810 [Monosporascus ibericus]|uniref:Uncharacterized protein n=1 Tax=Monosporascus ibericus TaxID=155417 RepID=A0A4Q4SU04_9PEZI|nr:hypothetical protein DL764_009810 [Monosporascus ibericus]
MGINSELSGARKRIWRRSGQSQACVVASPETSSGALSSSEVQKHGVDVDGFKPRPAPKVATSRPVSCPEPHAITTDGVEYRRLRNCVEDMRGADLAVDQVGRAYVNYTKLRGECSELCKSLLDFCLGPIRPPPLEPSRLPFSPRSVSTGADDPLGAVGQPPLITPPSTGSTDDSRSLPGRYLRGRYLETIKDWKSCQENLLEALRASLLQMYHKVDPSLTHRGFELLCADENARKFAINQIQDASLPPEMKSIHISLFDAPTTSLAGASLTSYEVRFSNYDLVLNDLNETRCLLQAAEAGVSPQAAIQECVITQRGDTMLEFANTDAENFPAYRFRVSSHMLAETSPVFARMFGLHSSGGTLDAGHAQVLPPPPTRHKCSDGSEVKLYRLPHVELNTKRAMEIVLHAAHMHSDMIPRDVDFDQFVAIAEVCLRYQCTSPLELIVEHRWLPKWMHKAVPVDDDVPDGLLTILYAFGARRLFARVSKTAILNIVDEADLRAKPWPHAVKDKLWAVREAKMEQVYACCRDTLREYLRPPPPPPPALALTGAGAAATVVAEPKGNGGGNGNGNATTGDRSSILMPTTTPRCPKGSHACDAASLGWLMMTFAELEVLPHIMGPGQDRGLAAHLPQPPRRSLNQLFDSLRFMASPPLPDHHGGVCDYASAFRSALNDVYNSVPGLTLYDVSGRHGWGLSSPSRHHPDDAKRQQHQQPAPEDQMRRPPRALDYSHHHRHVQGRVCLAEAPEALRLRILGLLDDLNDLHAAAMVSRSWYETYKKNELALMRGIVRRRTDRLSFARAQGAVDVDNGGGGAIKDGTAATRVAGRVPAFPVSCFEESDDDDDDTSGSDYYDNAADGETAVEESHGNDSEVNINALTPTISEGSRHSSLYAMMTREEAEQILWPPSIISSSSSIPSPSPPIPIIPTKTTSITTAASRGRQLLQRRRPQQQQQQRASTSAGQTSREKFLGGGFPFTEHKILLPGENKQLRETYEHLIGIPVREPPAGRCAG